MTRPVQSREKSHDPSGVRLSLALPLSRAAAELSQAAHACTSLQWAISALLERAHHPDLAAELHMLQDIDRLQQTLSDLAALVDLASAAPQLPELDIDQIGRVVRLDSLRARLLPTQSLSATTVRADPSSDITWL